MFAQRATVFEVIQFKNKLLLWSQWHSCFSYMFCRITWSRWSRSWVHRTWRPSSSTLRWGHEDSVSTATCMCCAQTEKFNVRVKTDDEIINIIKIEHDSLQKLQEIKPMHRYDLVFLTWIPKTALFHLICNVIAHVCGIIMALWFFTQDIIKVHFALLRAIDLNMVSGGSGLGKIFLDFKERLVPRITFLLLGVYCFYCDQFAVDEVLKSAFFCPSKFESRGVKRSHIGSGSWGLGLQD